MKRQIQDIIHQILLEADRKQVQFHAHFWGKFDLVEEVISDGHHYIATGSSSYLDRRLSYTEGNIFLHRNNEVPLLIAEDLSLFFNNPIIYNDILVFDARPSYESLFTAQQMYVSEFRDPEDFEEVEAYDNLIKGIDNHFDRVFGITGINGEENGQAKNIQIQMDNFNWVIKIQKELFDLEVLHSLNRLLQQKGITSDKLYLSIDPNMFMVILKLDQDTLEMSTKMGLIV